jgi:adenosylhomocysteine nucleosidase
VTIYNNIGGDVGSIGGGNTFHGPVAGSMTWPGGERPKPSSSGAEIGVLTVLPSEIRAVTAAFKQMYDYSERPLRHGPLAREAWLPDPTGGRVRVAAVQTLQPGTESAALAYRGLVDEYDPAAVLLVGIAGGVSPRIGVGDVVISDEVILYDPRKLVPGGVAHRGQSQPVAAELRHRVNDFFAATPVVQHRSSGESYGLHHGPIGSGNAVVTDPDAEIRRWLCQVNEKVLAVETEAAGVAQSFHESVGRDDRTRGWLTIRGISDTADLAKNDDHHDRAARHAAEVMAMLVPFLRLGAGT